MERCGRDCTALAHFFVGNAFFLGPIDNRKIYAKGLEDFLMQTGGVPLLGISLLGDVACDQVLDNLQQKGNVNTIFAYTFDYEESRLRKDGAIPLPDHGVSGSALVGGAFAAINPKYSASSVRTGMNGWKEPASGLIRVYEKSLYVTRASGGDSFFTA